MYVITYREKADGPVLRHGPVAGTPFDAHDDLIGKYAAAGLTAPGHILQFKESE